MKIIYDIHGKCICIGLWDYEVEQAQDGTSVVLNPLPEGAYEVDIDNSTIIKPLAEFYKL